jgi:hypothetical protein
MMRATTMKAIKSAPFPITLPTMLQMAPEVNLEAMSEDFIRLLISDMKGIINKAKLFRRLVFKIKAQR